MAVTADTSAPYAPPTAVMEIVMRFRKGLPAPIDAAVLGRAGISDSLIPRTLQALQSLDLITNDGTPTVTLEGLRRAPEPEFKARLAVWLKEAYADVLSFIDPATADDVAIRDAFRNYNPVGQQPRMVTLFTGLCAAAGLRISEKKTNGPRAKPIKVHTTPMSTKAKNATTREQLHIQNNVPPALAGLMASLPTANDGWSKEARDKFMTTFGTVLDFCFPIVGDQ